MTVILNLLGSFLRLRLSETVALFLEKKTLLETRRAFKDEIQSLICVKNGVVIIPNFNKGCAEILVSQKSSRPRVHSHTHTP